MVGPRRALAISLFSSPFLSDQHVASAFLTQTPPPPRQVHKDASPPPRSSEWGPLRMTVPDDELLGLESVEENKSLADFSATRRRILFSMLTTASSVPLMSGGVDRAIAATADVPNTVGAATTASAAAAAVAFFAKNDEILKSPKDKRKYEAYTLGNGLRVLLCSDPTSQEAAAAMDVHVGATSDPPEVQGLAHFCEHMLFLGTEQYPNEGSFEQFLTNNSGRSNAFTDSEDTVYYFDMDAEDDKKLEEGLKRFASFFTSPLFTQSATSRELNAIESEHSKNLQSDIFRLYQIEKGRANQDHPFSKFFTGNKATLLDDTKKKGIDLREELIKFYSAYYSANQMSFAIVGPQSLITLKKMVEAPFSAIPNKNVGAPENKWLDIPPFKEGKTLIPANKNIVEILPVQELRQVTLSWPIVFESKEDSVSMDLVKPDFYATHLLGHEGPGSLLSYLKSQGWANALGAGTNTELSNFETFEISIELTSKGLVENLDDVVAGVFCYINMLREGKIPNYIFDEVLKLSELEWRFLQRGSAGGYAQSLVKAVVDYGGVSPSLVVAGPRKLALRETPTRLLSSGEARTEFASAAQRDEAKHLSLILLSKLTVDDAFVTVISKDFEGKTDKVEKWYGTQYRARPIPTTTLEKWSAAPPASSLGIALPRPNVFIPSEKGLRLKSKVFQEVTDARARSFEDRMKPIRPPSLIRDDGEAGRWTVYHKQDDRFGEPKAFVIFQLLTNEVYASADKAALAQLYQTSATDILNEYAYDAGLAGLSYDIQVLPRGIRLTFGGYNDKLDDFASYISQKLSRDINDVLPENDAEFDRYKDNLMRALTAFNVKQPYAHAVYYSALTLQPRSFQYTNAQLRDAVRRLTLPDLREYAASLWSSGKGEALIQGNLDKKEALALVDKIDNTVGFKTIPIEEYPPRLKALPLPVVAKGSEPSRLSLSEPNPSNNNAATQIVFQCLDESEKAHVLVELLNSVISEPFFEDLRTKQQLGYIVSTGVKAIGNTRTLSFVVQSNVAPVSKLTDAAWKFLEGVRSTYLEPLNEGDIGVYVKGLVDAKTEPDKRLSIEVTRNWSEISSGRLQFNRLQAEAAAALNLSKDDLLQYWDDLFADNGRILIAEVVPKVGNASSKAPPTTTGYAEGNKKGSYLGNDGSLRLGIDDIDQYRRDREDYLAAS